MEIKSRPHPFIYVIRRSVGIAGSFYFRDQRPKIKTPERLLEQCSGYINIVTAYDYWISALLEVDAMAPSKTDSYDNGHTTTLVG